MKLTVLFVFSVAILAGCGNNSSDDNSLPVGDQPELDDSSLPVAQDTEVDSTATPDSVANTPSDPDEDSGQEQQPEVGGQETVDDTTEGSTEGSVEGPVEGQAQDEPEDVDEVEEPPRGSASEAATATFLGMPYTQARDLAREIFDGSLVADIRNLIDRAVPEIFATYPFALERPLSNLLAAGQFETASVECAGKGSASVSLAYDSDKNRVRRQYSFEDCESSGVVLQGSFKDSFRDRSTMVENNTTYDLSVKVAASGIEASIKGIVQAASGDDTLKYDCGVANFWYRTASLEKLTLKNEIDEIDIAPLNYSNGYSDKNIVVTFLGTCVYMSHKFVRGDARVASSALGRTFNAAMGGAIVWPFPEGREAVEQDYPSNANLTVLFEGGDEETLRVASSGAEDIEEVLVDITDAGGARGFYDIWNFESQNSRGELPTIEPENEEIISETELTEGELVEGELTEDELVEGELIEGELIEGLLVEGELVEGELVEGELVEGELVEGELVEGELVEGELVEGELVEGELVEGELVEGELVEGELVEGELVEGELVEGELVEGELVEGELVEGELVEGELLEGELVEGELVEGELVEGELVEGELVEGELVEGELVEGELVEGELVEGELVEGELLEGVIGQPDSSGGEVSEPVDPEAGSDSEGGGLSDSVELQDPTPPIVINDEGDPSCSRLRSAVQASYGDLGEETYVPASSSNAVDTFTFKYPAFLTTIEFTRGSDLFGCVATFQSDDPDNNVTTVIERPPSSLFIEVPQYNGARIVTRNARLRGDLKCISAASDVASSRLGRPVSTEVIEPGSGFPIDRANKQILRFAAQRDVTVTLRHGLGVNGCEVELQRKLF